MIKTLTIAVCIGVIYCLTVELVNGLRYLSFYTREISRCWCDVIDKNGEGCTYNEVTSLKIFA